uniref:RING finger protein 113A n=1 Tax=Ditylenchus dipsaci TaxID=166011 RepID=A0A915DEQ3_9BILA
MEKKDSTSGGAARGGGGRYGPIRASPYIRSTVRWDYAPDICKDFKETGFCTFGDSCKFLHDRGDYKHGWELERDWEAGRLKESKNDEYAVASDEEQREEMPRLCFLCHNSFKNPVVTKCKHYFCEKCAIDHYQKSKKCAECGSKTNGCFSVTKLKQHAENDEQVKRLPLERKITWKMKTNMKISQIMMKKMR